MLNFWNCFSVYNLLFISVQLTVYIFCFHEMNLSLNTKSDALRAFFESDPGKVLALLCIFFYYCIGKIYDSWLSKIINIYVWNFFKFFNSTPKLCDQSIGYKVHRCRAQAHNFQSKDNMPSFISFDQKSVNRKISLQIHKAKINSVRTH